MVYIRFYGVNEILLAYCYGEWNYAPESEKTGFLFATKGISSRGDLKKPPRYMLEPDTFSPIFKLERSCIFREMIKSTSLMV